MEATALYQNSPATGAAGLDKGDTASAASGEPETQPSATAWRDPLGEFKVLDDDQWDLIFHATSATQQACMEDLGFSWLEPRMIDSRDDDQELGGKTHPDDWWGVKNLISAKEIGYHDPPATSSQNRGDSYSDLDVPEGYMEALYGQDITDKSNPGCYTKAWNELHEGVIDEEAIDTFTSAILNKVDAIARSDATVAEASARWSTCMADAGYRYSDPHAAFTEFVTIQEQPDGSVVSSAKAPSATDEEKRVAVADATCKDSTGFWAVWDEATYQTGTAMVNKNRPLAEQYRENQLTQLRNAEKMLAEHGG